MIEATRTNRPRVAVRFRLSGSNRPEFRANTMRYSPQSAGALTRSKRLLNAIALYASLLASTSLLNGSLQASTCSRRGQR